MASILTAQPELFYFGKFPSRGDFVKSTAGGPILQVFDQWISQAIDMITPDPNWKAAYDATPPLRFAFLGSRLQLVVTGTLMPSQDASGRRYPLVLATKLETDSALDLLSELPLVLSPFWQESILSSQQALRETSDNIVLNSLQRPPTPINNLGREERAQHDHFLRGTTVAMLEHSLSKAGYAFSLRQSMLGLGLLLQPVITHGAGNLQRALLFPLPADPITAISVATFWLREVRGFLLRHEFEISVYLTQVHDKPAMMVSFGGASPKALTMIICPDALSNYLVDISDSAWVEEYIDQDPGMRKLSSYLQHPDLSLAQATDTFNEVFLGW
ncbi:type VI secretion system protein ImpM [Chitinivorax tropicus]|uniref:Type VI secretion system protein ImpM n=1 Tax=Chitinivorax tropicus TaxID=714531 RepID=A0A840MLZ1_9PROT|nr:type VI secretion system-associated protein TagF [Chitinivorax tropicus]MBB5017722.1 type VI secretion system protein ImpM [Chitinivorax tropicus]